MVPTPRHGAAARTAASAVGVAAVLLSAIMCACACALLLRGRAPGGKDPFTIPAGSPTAARVVASLTTTPQRLDKLGGTLDSLLAQTVTPDRIYLNIPHVFKRTGEAYDLARLPSRYANHPLVKVVRCDDFGPITKLLPTIGREQALGSPESTLLWVVDDDHVYPPNYLQVALGVAEAQPRAAVSLSCTDLYTVADPAERSAYPEPRCGVAEAFAGILYRLGFFASGLSLSDYLAVALASDACFRSDDFVVSNYLEMKHIPRVKIVSPLLGLKDLKTLEYGLQSDALHKSDASMGMRYDRCNAYLRARGYGSDLETVIR